MDKINIIDLDNCVINALDLFIKNKIPEFDFDRFVRPIIIGSGNASITGKILFHDKDAVFANESDFKEKIKKDIDGAIIISASGGKHAPIIAKELKKNTIKTILLTNNKNPPAKKYVDEHYIFKKNIEPYTYNTSTYLSMILSKTKEDPKKILTIIDKLKKTIPNNLGKYNSFYIILPNEFELLREMFITKFDELFGPMILGRVYTIEETKHAKTIIPSDKELFISLGYDNKIFGKNRLNIDLPKNISYAGIISVGYFIIGNIQKQHPPYFKENIVRYCLETSKVFNENITPIVE